MDNIELFGKYRLVERVAVGGMAEIFKASTHGAGGFERFVAIKRLHRHLSEDEELAQMLVDEAKISVRLQHANIAQIFDLGSIDGQYFIVMEYIDGSDLYGVLRRMREQGRTMPIALALYAVSKMLGGLDFAHNTLGSDGRPLDIVHRDISPQNIMINIQGEVKLVDFGIAKARMRLMETQAGIIKGKFYYMSPEQAHGHHLDRRTDIFATGMVLYELLTNRPAYEETNDLALLKRVRVCGFEPPSRWRPDLSPELEGIVTKALKRDPKLRYQSAREFQSVLQQHIQRQFGAINEHHLAEFIREVVNPVSQEAIDHQVLMQRDQFMSSGESLIFDASDLAISLDDDSQELEAIERTHVRERPKAPVQNNPFAIDEPTQVFLREDDNPFAVPDAFTAEPTHTDNVQWSHPVEEPKVPQRTVASAPSASSSVEVDFAQLEEFPDEGPTNAVPNVILGAPDFRQNDQQSATRSLPVDSSMRASATPVFQTFGASPPKRESSEDSRVLPLIFGMPKTLDRKIRVAVLLLFVTLLGVLMIILSMDDKGPSTEPIAVAPPESSQALLASQAPPVVAPPVKPQQVDITFISIPRQADVYVDGVLRGQTPKNIGQLEVGKDVKVEFKKKGFESMTQTLSVSAMAAPVEVKLVPEIKSDGIIKVVTVPPSLRIEIDGRFVGRSPVEHANLDKRRVYEVLALQEDGTMKRNRVAWGSGDTALKSVEFAFDASGVAQNKRDLPEPPIAVKTSPKPKRRYRPRRRPRREETRDDPPEEKSVNIWGGSKKKKAKTPTPKKNVNVWGG